MKTKRTNGRLPGLGAALVASLLSFGQAAPAQTSGGPLAQAEAAIAAGDYFRATRILTAIAAQRNNPDSQRAQELLATAREANGQLAQALAEYDEYLKRYPGGDGAARVRVRRAALVGGGGGSDGTRAGGTVSLTYRMNDGGERPDAFTPFDKRFSALTLALQFSTTSQSANGRSRLVFSGAGDLSSSGIPSRDPKISEAFFDYTWASNGAAVTVGRFRPEPGGIGYRVDGVQLSWPVADRVTLGVDAGKAVESSRDDLFSDDRTLLAASLTFRDSVLPGALAFYVAQQSDGTDTFRSAVGAEYARDFKGGGNFFASVEYDFHFDRVSRVQVSGGLPFSNGDRLTASAAFYRSPALNLENATFGPGFTIEDLRLGGFTEAQIKAFALDQSAQVTTASLYYTTKVSANWTLTLDGSVISFDGPRDNALTSGNLTDLGTRVYAGGTLIGSSVFTKGDSVNLGLRLSEDEDDRLYAFDASIFFPVTDNFSLRPRIRVGKRMNDFGPDDDIVMGALGARYRFDRTTSLIVDVGAKNEDQDEFFVNAGISKSF
ncbi:MAG: hypothetical protein ACKVPY_00170 [Paracoccaceae bacterium]